MAKRPTTHRGHEPGFCDWVCFPKRLKEEYAAKSGHDCSTPDRRADVEDRVVLWAQNVRKDWEGRAISESLWDFWRARWAELEVTDQYGRVVPQTPPRGSREAWRAKQDYPRVPR